MISRLRPGGALSALVPALFLTLSAGPLEAQEIPPLSTFSIVACDLDEGFWGVGIQSRVVSAGSIVPAARAGVGAIATQALANVAYKDEGLALLADGMSAEEVRDHFVETDEGQAQRQFSIVDRECRVATHTGESTLDWAGHRTGPGYSVQGNILTGPEVVEAMARAYEEATEAGWPFGERILAALKAGQDAGGDARGRQGAGLLIVKEEGGYGGGDDRYANLRVEDHVEPILELERVYDVWMSVFHPRDHFVPRGRKAVSVPSGPHICELREMLTVLGYDSFEPGSGPCALNGPVLEALGAFQRDHGLREVPGVNEDTARRLRQAVAEVRDGAGRP
jgi:uncharacterized Ntn-hydrolase superfamily protein